MVKINTSDFLKPTDLDGDTTVEFVDEGKYSDSQFKDAQGNPKQNFNITVRFGEAEEKVWTMNKTSQRNIVSAYGDESSLWIGKYAKLSIIRMMVGKEMRDVIIGEPCDSGAHPMNEAELDTAPWSE
jgi:hypothetical protein